MAAPDQDVAEEGPPATRRPRRWSAVRAWLHVVLAAAVALLGLAVLLGARTITELPILDDPVGARGFAYVLGTFVFLGGLLVTVREWRRGPSAAPADAKEDPAHSTRPWRPLVIMGLLLAYALALPRIGYLLSTVAMVTAGLVLMEVRTRLRLWLYPTLFALASFLIFRTGMGVRLPEPLLQPVLRSLGLM